MRLTRAYLAGLGATGSLLAVAAIAFVLASVFVSFRGWPVGGAQLPPTVILVKSPAGQNRSDRGPAINPGRVAATLAARGLGRVSTAAISHGAGKRTLVVVSRPPALGPVEPLAPVGRLRLGPRDPVGPPPPRTNSSTNAGSCSRACTANPPNGGLGPLLESTTRQLGAALVTTTSGLESGLRQLLVDVTAGRLLARANPQVSGVVSGTGQALGSTISQTAQAADGVLSGVGRRLSAGLAPPAPR